MATIVILRTLAEILRAGGTVVKVRLLADPMFDGTRWVRGMTVSYVECNLNGETIYAEGLDGLTGTAATIKSEMIRYGKDHNLYMKPSGVLTNWDIF